MSKKLKPLFAARFGIGDKVRVRRGVMDNDYPDMPIGGWAARLPLGELGDARGKSNRELIEDYCYWLHNYA